MNRYSILAALMLIFIAGCLQPGVPIEENEETNGVTPTPECRIVYVEEPYTEEVCQEVGYIEEECEMKELEYTSGRIMKTDLCSADGDCVGKNLYECFYTCTAAMKRCRMNITNNDPKLAGTWVVGATFSYDGAAFVKNPEQAMIEPNETYTFDFEQIYALGSPPVMATCTITVIYPAVGRDCVQVEKTRIECQDVEKTRIIQEEVCD